MTMYTPNRRQYEEDKPKGCPTAKAILIGIAMGIVLWSLFGYWVCGGNFPC